MYLLQEVKPKPTKSIPLLSKTLEIANTSLRSLVDLLKSYKINHSAEYRAHHEKEKKKYTVMDPKYREIHILGNLGVRARTSTSQAEELYDDIREKAYDLR